MADDEVADDGYNDDYNDDDNDYYNAYDDDNNDDYYDDGWGDYEETTLSPDVWFFLGFLLLAVIPMLVVVPAMVTLVKRKKRRKKQRAAAEAAAKLEEEGAPFSEPYYVMEEENRKETNKKRKKKHQQEKKPIFEIETDVTNVRSSARAIFRLDDKETKRILRYALPFTFSGVSKSILSNVCLALIAHFVGTKQVSAFVIVEVILSISQDFAKGPLDATATLCSHAIGAGNSFLAGQYVQLSWLFYSFVSAPLVAFWIIYMERVVLFLEWGDGLVAQYAHDLTRIYIFRHVVDSLRNGIDYLLEITDHVAFTTVMALLHELVNAVLLALMIRMEFNVTVQIMSWMFLSTSLFFFFLTICISWSWIKPFRRGMFSNFAMRNGKAVNAMTRTSIPLALGSGLSNAEWTVLAFFASHLGPAEVAGWAFVGSLWEAIDSATEGIGDAAELRVAYHLGNNNPTLAKLSAYKSLFLGLLISFVITAFLLVFSGLIPGWLTPDDTLERMIGESLPYMAIGNISFIFGMLCWYLVGAQGRYKLGTWIQFGASWGVTIPLAALLTYKFNMNISGLTASVALGYVSAGTFLSFIVLTSDWQALADKVRRQEEESDSESESEEEEEGEEDERFAALASGKCRAARAIAGRNRTLLVAPPGPIQINIGTVEGQKGPVVVDVPPLTSLDGMLFSGDRILAIDGIDVRSKPLWQVHDLLRNGDGGDQRELAVSRTPRSYRDDGMEPDTRNELEENERQDADRGLFGTFTDRCSGGIFV